MMKQDFANEECSTLTETLCKTLDPADVKVDMLTRLSRAHDASIYRMVPSVVVKPRHVADVQAVFAACHAHKTGVTFRGAGTSLSGQAVTDQVLLETRYWRRVKVSEDGLQVSAQPGVIGGHLNALLARFGRRIGPDPASIASCMVGGIVANNASGMCCGVHDNAYKTLAEMTIVFADGFVLDTADPAATQKLATEKKLLHDGLLAIRDEINARPDLVQKIAKKFRIKNTMGYGLNAFIDFELPLDILSHLLVGSEGTLAFLADVTLKTVPEPKYKATAIAYFADLVDASSAIDALAAAGATVIEIMDRASLAALATEMAYPFALTERCAALLVEFQESDGEKLQAKIHAGSDVLYSARLLAPVRFTQDPAERARYWHLRKGLFPKVGAQRRLGTSVIIEDVCFPRASLASAVTDLQALFSRHQFEAVIFGHAKEGNLHFVLSPDFHDPQEVLRYKALMEDLATLVIERYDGSLKAEHGTGRNMAPFVEREWGSELYAIMCRVKKIFDPHGILNPGVLINDDAEVHLRNLKALPAVSALVDQCIECGFCESVCPSRDLSLTPRQRIALQREIAHAKQRPDEKALAEELVRGFQYAGVDTCAGDGMCASVCPVGIDTGAYMREFKSASRSRFAQRVALTLASRLEWLAVGARTGLRAVNLLSGRAKKLRGIPLPRPASSRRVLKNEEAAVHTPKVVFFSACLSQIMASSDKSAPAITTAVMETMRLCGWDVIPASSGVKCCGQAFASKGYEPAARRAAEDLIDALWMSSAEGARPIVCDTSPCTSRLLTLGDELSAPARERWRKLSVYDFPSFMAQKILPARRDWPRLERRVVLHPTCSTVKHGGVADLLAVAKAFASDVQIPVSAGCCGFAGDKGFQRPELTRSATSAESDEVRSLVSSWQKAGHKTFAYSTCQTCALGMEASTGVTYHSIADLCFDALRIDNKKLTGVNRI